MKKIAPMLLVNNILNVFNLALQQYNAVMYVCVCFTTMIYAAHLRPKLG